MAVLGSQQVMIPFSSCCVSKMTSLYFTEQRAENELAARLDLQKYDSGTGIAAMDFLDRVHFPAPYGAAIVPPAGPFPTRMNLGVADADGTTSYTPYIVVGVLLLWVLMTR
jgi:hypothetical protein